jgi:hypothetical protein
MALKRHPLIARKEILRLWYEFYRLALKSTDKGVQAALKKSQNLYAPWEVKLDEAFDDWWQTHEQLFREQVSSIRIFDADEVRTDSNLYVVIPKRLAHKAIVEGIQRLLAIEDPTARGQRRKVPPQHRYAPTEIQGLKIESLRLLLALMQHVFADTTLRGQSLVDRVRVYFSVERYKRKQNTIPQPFQGTSEHVSRNIRRYRQRGKKLLLNVASGKFPGAF